MIIACPQCQRKYRLTEEYAGKVIRCVCTAILKVPVPGEEPAVPQAAPTPPPPAAEPKKEEAPVSQESDAPVEKSWFEKIVFPDMRRPLDLSPFSAGEEEGPELPDVEEVPDFDDEIPDFDDDDMNEGAEDIEENIPDMDLEDEDPDTMERQSSLDNLEVESEVYVMDPRVPALLEELGKSQDPQFIIDALFYLLEVKDTSIEGAVKKFLGNDNPLADYYAQRILADFARMTGADGKKPEVIEPFKTDRLYKNFFHSPDQMKKQMVDYSVNNREFSAMPYFITQLMREGNVNVICDILSRGSLLGNEPEIPFISHFLKHENQRVRLACIEGLSAVNGEGVLKHLIAGLMDRDVVVVNAIKDALKASDKDEVAREIIYYLRDHDVDDKKGYIAILQDYKNINGFRALVWMFDDPMVRNDALEASKNFDIPPESKIPIYEEYLMLSYDDNQFSNLVIEALEAIHPNYDRSRLIPVSTFDDSYTGLVRLSPLFARDFAEEDEDTDQDIVEEVEIEDFDLKLALTDPLMKIKDQFGQIKFLVRSKANLPFVLGQGMVFTVAGIFTILSFLKVFGTSEKVLPKNIFPNRFSTTESLSILSDPILGKGFVSLSSILFLTILVAWLLGSSMAMAQLKKNSKKISALPLIPVLLSPFIPAYSFGLLQTNFPAQAFTENFLTLLLVFPCSAIFYLIFHRLFQIVPRSQLEGAMQLGATEDQAFGTVYAPLFHIGSLFGALFCVIYLFSCIQLTHLFDSDKALGAIYFSRMELGSTWLHMGGHGLFLALPLFFLLLAFEALIPLFSLFPSGQPGESDHPFTDHVQRWMSIAGFLFYSRMFGTIGKSSDSKEKPKKEKKSKKADKKKVEKADAKGEKEEPVKKKKKKKKKKK